MNNPDDIYATEDTLAFHREQIVFDCLSLQYVLQPDYVDRNLAGGVTVTNVTVATENQTWDTVLATVDSSLEAISRNPNLILATTAADIRRAKTEGKLAAILGTQGSDFVGTDLYRIRLLHALGIRFFGLAYTGATLHGSGCGERRDAGLTFLGRELVELVNTLPAFLDLSHAGHETRLEAANLALHPVCTHSNSFAVNPNERNTKDDVARIIAEKGGALGICGMPKSVAPENPSAKDMVRHMRHYMDLLGPGHVGLGLDFTEAYQDEYRAGRVVPQTHSWRKRRPDIFGSSEDFFTQLYPKGLESIRLLPNLTQEMFDGGFSKDEVSDILGGTWLRTFESVVG